MLASVAPGSAFRVCAFLRIANDKLKAHLGRTADVMILHITPEVGMKFVQRNWYEVRAKEVVIFTKA
jgi:hypothetical protein